MRHCNQGRFQQQISFLRRQFLQESELPFSDVLSKSIVEQALTTVGVIWNDGIYTPLVTLWVFLSQVLSADHSCRIAVSRLIAHRISHGQRACSPETSAYCQARKRLPEAFFSLVACAVGRALDDEANPQWLWKERRVYLFDGTTVSMPDTPENLEAYSKTYNQKPGLGFPIARVGAITSLSCGAILNVGFCRYAGKGQGEVSLLRRMWNILRPGDVLLADSLMSNWTSIAMLQERGFELVSRLNKAHRKADFRKGTRLGKSKEKFETSWLSTGNPYRLLYNNFGTNICKRQFMHTLYINSPMSIAWGREMQGFPKHPEPVSSVMNDSQSSFITSIKWQDDLIISAKFQKRKGVAPFVAQSFGLIAGLEVKRIIRFLAATSLSIPIQMPHETAAQNEVHSTYLAEIRKGRNPVAVRCWPWSCNDLLEFGHVRKSTQCEENNGHILLREADFIPRIVTHIPFMQAYVGANL